MKKVLITIIALIMAGCSLFAIGCKDDVKANDENSYVVSFYFLERHQDVSGKVVEEGFAFWKSCNVIKGQLLELDGYEQEYDYYKKENGTIVEAGEKGYFKPTDNATIYVRKRSKKTINFYVYRSYYDVVDIKNIMTEEEMEEYRDEFVDTYEESLVISSKMTEIFKKASYTTSGYYLKFEFYTTKDCSGKPFFTKSDYYSSQYNYDIRLIKSTNVYVKVSKA